MLSGHMLLKTNFPTNFYFFICCACSVCSSMERTNTAPCTVKLQKKLLIFSFYFYYLMDVTAAELCYLAAITLRAVAAELIHMLVVLCQLYYETIR